MGIIPGGVASALVLASFFRLNRLAAISGVMATNMWSTIAVLPLAAFVGSAIFGRGYAELVLDYKNCLGFGWEYFFGRVVFFDVTLPLLLGFFVVALVIAAAAYGIMYGILKRNKIRMKK